MNTELIEFSGCFARNPGEIEAASLVFLGLPDGSQSSYLRGCENGPSAIRKALDGRSYNSTTELGVDLAGRIADLGDVTLGATFDETAERFRDATTSILKSKRTPFLVGGDHAVTVPAVLGFEAFPTEIHVVQIDAHPDLYPEYEGSRSSHACTGARLLEMNHVSSLTQIGIRTLTEEQEKIGKQHEDRLTILPAREVTRDSIRRIQEALAGKPVYITLDLDGLDPAYAPGVSHPVPGGLTSRQVLDFLQQATFDLVGMDLVELNVEQDLRSLTAILGGHLLQEAMGRKLAHSA